MNELSPLLVSLAAIVSVSLSAIWAVVVANRRTNDANRDLVKALLVQDSKPAAGALAASMEATDQMELRADQSAQVKPEPQRRPVLMGSR